MAPQLDCTDEEASLNRRGFIKKSAIAAGLAGSVETPPTLAQSGGRSQQTTDTPPADNRSADYLRRVRRDELLPKPPAIRDSSGTEVKISPMPLAERVQRHVPSPVRTPINTT